MASRMLSILVDILASSVFMTEICLSPSVIRVSARVRRSFILVFSNSSFKTLSWRTWLSASRSFFVVSRSAFIDAISVLDLIHDATAPHMEAVRIGRATVAPGGWGVSSLLVDDGCCHAVLDGGNSVLGDMQVAIGVLATEANPDGFVSFHFEAIAKCD